MPQKSGESVNGAGGCSRVIVKLKHDPGEGALLKSTLHSGGRALFSVCLSLAS